MPVSPVQMPLSPTPNGPVWMSNPSVDTVTLINLDTTNSVYIGNTSSISVNSANTIQLQPNASIAYPGNTPIYAVALAGTKPLLIAPGSISYSPGGLAIVGNVNAVISGNVNIANTPDVTIAGQLTALNVSAATVNIDPTPGSIFPPGSVGNLYTLATPTTISSVTTPIINVQNYTAVDLGIAAYCTSQATAGAPLTAWLQIQWYDDSAATKVVYDEDWFFWVSNSSLLLDTVTGTLPVRGSYMQARILNNPLATVNATLQNFWITGTYRSVPYSSLHQTAPNSISCSGATMNVANNNSYATNDLGWLNTVTPGTGLQVYTLPLFAGSAWVQYEVNTAALTQVPTIVDMTYGISGSVSGGTGMKGVLWQGPNTTATLYQGMINLPRAPSALIVNPAATSSIQFACIGQQGV